MILTTFLLVVSLWFYEISALKIGSIQNARIKASKRDVLQNIVSWDEHSLIVHGERIMIYSGEVHPFRLPSSGLWLDVFQKVKAMGFSAVSFYTYWGLLEGNPGHFIAEGVFNLDEFFAAASEAGIYLIARPGEYINAETAAGGIPGWVLPIKGVIRSTDSDYLATMNNYVAKIGKIIADAQITNGGPVIMVQPENEYASWPGVVDFPDAMNREYMAYVEQQLLDAGIVVPFVVNDNLNIGSFAPGTGLGEVELYGIDAYPMRYDCGDPYIWPTLRFPKTWEIDHQNNSPTTPFTIAEFQGGGGDSWGGVGEDRCAILTNNDAIKVQFKNTYSFGVTIFNVYMIYGGTNWGNLGYHGGYTSYDYGASITEDRQIWREKYSEMKLEAHFLKASPAYLTATPGEGTNGTYGTPSSIAVTPLFGVAEGNGTSTNFYIIRHADFTSTLSTEYKLVVQTSSGNITVPQFGGDLVMNGRDSKIFVTDYDVGGINMIYSTAEIYTWAEGTNSWRTLILYGGEGEVNEAAFSFSLGTPKIIEGSDVDIGKSAGIWLLQWKVTPLRQIVEIGKLRIYLLWRNEAYNYWSLELPAPGPIGNYTSPSKSTVIVKAGYLLRTANIEGNQLFLTGDVNATTTLEVISTPANVTSLFFNYELLHTIKSNTSNLLANLPFDPPTFTLPDLSALSWKYIDSLPELSLDYSDELWTPCDHTTSNNPLNLSTPTSMYASDYGYHTGSLIYRGHFISLGSESSFFINTTGGYGFAHSIFLNSTHLGSSPGNLSDQTYAQTLSIPSSLNLVIGDPYVLTVVIDHMGQDEEAPGTDAIKFPRGILDYRLSSSSSNSSNSTTTTPITWLLTGNLHSPSNTTTSNSTNSTSVLSPSIPLSNYYTLSNNYLLGPRNEGAFYAERQGYHLISPPSSTWETRNPITQGISGAGIGFFTTEFALDLPESGWDLPLGVIFGGLDVKADGGEYRVQIFVNGYQFGKFVSNLGPQTTFPVPQGVLNHQGNNTLALTLWALSDSGARVEGLSLGVNATIKSGYDFRRGGKGLVPMVEWEERVGGY